MRQKFKKMVKLGTFPQIFKNGPFCHSKAYLLIYKPMNRVQKQHNLDQIFYFEKIIGKIVFLPRARVRGARAARLLQTRKNISKHL